jgi:mono/diheme cytochrome c family protein
MVHSVSPGRAAALVVVAVGVLALVGCQSAVSKEPKSDPVARGKYLVTVGVCADCHTPMKMGANGPEPDLSRSFSGHPETLAVTAPPIVVDDWTWGGTSTNTAFYGPWGISFSANLTPHDTGLGVWSEDIFIKAIRTGQHMGAGRPILPPMPVQAYGQMTDEDLAAVWAYLQTLPPIDNVVPAIVPPTGMGMPAGS